MHQLPRRKLVCGANHDMHELLWGHIFSCGLNRIHCVRVLQRGPICGVRRRVLCMRGGLLL